MIFSYLTFPAKSVSANYKEQTGLKTIYFQKNTNLLTNFALLGPILIITVLALIIITIYKVFHNSNTRLTKAMHLRKRALVCLMFFQSSFQLKVAYLQGHLEQLSWQSRPAGRSRCKDKHFCTFIHTSPSFLWRCNNKACNSWDSYSRQEGGEGCGWQCLTQTEMQVHGFGTVVLVE